MFYNKIRTPGICVVFKSYYSKFLIIKYFNKYLLYYLSLLCAILSTDRIIYFNETQTSNYFKIECIILVRFDETQFY